MIAEATVTPTHSVSTGPQHLSWSGIQDYQNCPKRFYFRRIARVPEESVCAALLFGGAIHTAIERVHEAQLEGRPSPTAKALLSAYDAAWKDGAAKGPEVVYAKDTSPEQLRQTARGVLTEYRRHAAAQTGTVIAIEHEATFSIVPTALPLKARLDLLLADGDSLIVSDLKTSRCRWSENKIREALPQLVLYSVAVAPIVRELGLKRIVPQFTVLTKGKSPALQVVQPKASQADVERLKMTVAETSDAVRKAVFITRPSWQCRSCPYARRCGGQGCQA